MSARTPLVTASHAALFENADEEPRCEVCRAPVEPFDADESPALHQKQKTDSKRSRAVPRVPGKAFYLWARGEQRRYEEAPLCASCAVALGVTALARWEVEEDG